MKIIQLHLCLFVWCTVTEGFTDTPVDLGQNVSLRCDISVNNVYWFLMKPSHTPVILLRTFSSTSTSIMYRNETLKKKFSLQQNSSLFIQNITLNELGIYYCIHTGLRFGINDGIKLHKRVYTSDYKNRTSQNTQFQDPSLDDKNRTSENKQFQDPTSDTDEGVYVWRISLIISGLLNCVLVITLTGLTVCYCKAIKKCRLTPPESDASDGVQYASINLQNSNRGVQSDNATCIYAPVRLTTRKDCTPGEEGQRRGGG